MEEKHDSLTEEASERAGAKPILFPVFGVLLGAGGALLQLKALRFGAIAPGQLPMFWAFFLGVGALLAFVVGIAARRLFRSAGGAYGIAIGVTAILLAIFVPLNSRSLTNVYLLITDTTRSDHLSLYGYDRETTPFLDELASEGVTFRQSISTGTHTIVSTPCIVASIYPSEHGIVGYSNVLSNRFTLLSEYLHEWGYRTYGYATNPHLGPRLGYAQGFDKYEHDPGWAQTPAGDVNRRFLRWIDDGNDVDGPLFSFLFYIDPHNPYEPPPAFQTLFDPGWKGAVISDWRHEDGKPEPGKLRNLIAQYDGAIAYWDAELRKLVGELKARGLWENSLLVYTSDHGEGFWEHGFWGHNVTMYEELCRVPLFFSFPVPVHFPPLRRTSGSVDEIVSSIDVVPTVLEFLRIAPDETARGRSALPLVFGGETGPERMAYCEEILKRYGPYDIRAIRTKTHKYIRIFNYEGDTGRGDLFFDLESDPGELKNLASVESEELDMHRRLLDLKMAEIAGKGSVKTDTVEVEPAVLERLKALGYLGD